MMNYVEIVLYIQFDTLIWSKTLVILLLYIYSVKNAEVKIF